MDQLTHTVRRSNWINIIRQCQDRPAGTGFDVYVVKGTPCGKAMYKRCKICDKLQKETDRRVIRRVKYNGALE